MKEQENKKYGRLSLQQVINDLRVFLPLPGPGRKGWRRLAVGEWATRYGVHRMTLHRHLKALETTGYIQYSDYYGSNQRHLTKVKATMKLIELPRGNVTVISIHSGFCSIPQTLKDTHQWVVWRYGDMRANGKRPKVPYDAKSSHYARASTNKPDTWASYEQAQNRLAWSQAKKYPYDGVGFVLTRDAGLVGIDVDDCITDGYIAAWAQAIIDKVNSYTEVSPSGKGVKIWVYGTLPNDGRKAQGLELYCHGHYFTVTGMHLIGTPTTIEHRQEAVTALYDALTTPAISHEKTVLPTACTDTQEEILQKARGAKNGQKFIDLYDLGNWQKYSYITHSEGDQGLCEMLAYWCYGDYHMIDRLFRLSALYRSDRWDRPARSDDASYGDGTIKRAIAFWQETT